MVNSRRFDWLSDEIAQVATPRYFQVDGPAGEDLRAAIEGSPLPLPSSYREFVLTFGNARLYKQHSGYGLGVLAAPRESEGPAGERFLEIGYCLGRKAYFREDLFGRGAESPVFEAGDGSGTAQVASGFEEWLRSRADSIKKKIGTRRWAEIVRGPIPFSTREEAIVAARRRYAFRQVGIADDGDVLIEVTNHSEDTLPFLSVGVRSKDGKVVGSMRVPVGDLPPGATKTAPCDCYKKLIPRAEVELFAQPDPTPADREAYWEFRAK